MPRRRPLGAYYPLTDDCQRVGSFCMVGELLLIPQLTISIEMENSGVLVIEFSGRTLPLFWR
jgi:hypothetical protein